MGNTSRTMVQYTWIWVDRLVHMEVLMLEDRNDLLEIKQDEILSIIEINTICTGTTTTI